MDLEDLEVWIQGPRSLIRSFRGSRLELEDYGMTPLDDPFTDPLLDHPLEPCGEVRMAVAWWSP